MINHFRFFLFREFQISRLFDGDFSYLDSFKYPKMHDGKIIILFPFFPFLFRLGTLIVGDANLACCNNVNCLNRFLWIRDGSCDVPVKGLDFNQVGLS